MSVRRLVGLLLAWLLVPGLAHADSHIADYYSGASGGGGGSKLYGFHEAFNLASRRSMGCYWGGGADFTNHFGSHDGKDETQFAYMFGPRCSIPLGTKEHQNLLHLQLLLGWVYTNDGTDNSKNDGAVGYSIAYDRVLKCGDGPTHCKGLTLRFQTDYINRSEDSGRSNFPRFSGGVVYRFSK